MREQPHDHRFHYIAMEKRTQYAAEASRMLRVGGRLLLRACMTAQGSETM